MLVHLLYLCVELCAKRLPSLHRITHTKFYTMQSLLIWSCVDRWVLCLQPTYLYAPGWKHYRKKLLGPAGKGGHGKRGASNPIFNPYTLLFITRMRRTIVKRKVKVLVLFASVSGTAKTFAQQVCTAVMHCCCSACTEQPDRLVINTNRVVTLCCPLRLSLLAPLPSSSPLSQLCNHAAVIRCSCSP